MSIVSRGLGLPGGAIVTGGLGRDPVVLHGDGYLDQSVGEVFGEGAFKLRAAQYAGARPGGRHGALHKPAFIIAEYQRQELERQIARVVTGEGSLERHGADISGSGRVKAARLVAVSASAEVPGSGDVDAVGEFVDIELEMVALLLAA